MLTTNSQGTVSTTPTLTPYRARRRDTDVALTEFLCQLMIPLNRVLDYLI